jgi:hypothetical protein
VDGNTVAEALAALAATSGDGTGASSSDDITNESDVVGATVTLALNTLNADIASAVVGGNVGSDAVANESTVTGTTVSDALESLKTSIGTTGGSSSSDDVSNESAVTGATVTVALNTLNARPAGGEVNQAVNTSLVTAGQASIISGKVGTDLVFKKLRRGANIIFDAIPDEVMIGAAIIAGRTLAITLTGPMDADSSGSVVDVSAIAFSAATPQTVLGLASPGPDGYVRTYLVYNPGNVPITLKHSASTYGAGSSFAGPGNADYLLKPNAVVIVTKADQVTPFVIRPLATQADLVVPVPSVFGRTGAVVPVADDYLASQIKNDAGFGGATVATALNALNAKAIPTGSSDLANQSSVTGGGATVTTALNALQTAVASAGGSDVLTFNDQTGTAYTFVLTDGKKDVLVRGSNAASQTFTIPSNSTVPFPIGTVLGLLWYGVGQPSFAIAGPDTLNPAGTTLKLRQRNSIAYATKMTATSWIASGDLA